MSQRSQLPYLPEGREILYVPETHPLMAQAKQVAQDFSRDPGHPIGCVIVRDDQVLVSGANGSDYHSLHGCRRKKLGIPTGQQYELCPGCDPANHAEQTALRNARERGIDVHGADIYLWGHWWCCQSCWARMIDAGIHDVYLLDEGEERFRKR